MEEKDGEIREECRGEILKGKERDGKIERKLCVPAATQPRYLSNPLCNLKGLCVHVQVCVYLAFWASHTEFSTQKCCNVNAD